MGQRKNAKGGANGVFKGSQLKRFTDGSKRERVKNSEAPLFEVTGTHGVPQRRAQGADPRADRHAPAAGPAGARGARVAEGAVRRRAETSPVDPPRRRRYAQVRRDPSAAWGVNPFFRLC